jgi:hypothetical protein
VKEVEGDVVQATQAVVAQYQQQLEEAQAADGACQLEASAHHVWAWQAAPRIWAREACLVCSIFVSRNGCVHRSQASPS